MKLIRFSYPKHMAKPMASSLASGGEVERRAPPETPKVYSAADLLVATMTVGCIGFVVGTSLTLIATLILAHP